MEKNNAANGAAGRKRVPKDPAKLKKELMRCVVDMVYDEKAKPSERLSAVKVLMDCFLGDVQTEGTEEMRVVFDSLPEGYAD